jgi:hypothetical protein
MVQCPPMTFFPGDPSMVSTKTAKRFRIEKLEERIAPSGWWGGWGRQSFEVNTNISTNINVGTTVFSTVNIGVFNSVSIRF